MQIMLSAVFVFFCCGYMATAQSVDKLEQAENGRLPNGILDPVTWTTGNVNAQKAHYTTGMTIPYRLGISGLTPGVTYRVVLGYDTKHGGKHAIDFLTSYDRSTFHSSFGHGDGELIQPWTVYWQANPGELRYELPEPDGHFVAATGTNQPYDEFLNVRDVEIDGGAEMTIYNGTIVGMAYIGGGIAGAQTTDQLQVDFQVLPGQNRILLAWGGHIASADQWGEGMSAEDINGSPYHMRISYCPPLDGETISGCGNKEVQLSATAVIAPTSPVCAVTGDELACFDDLGELLVEWIDGEGPFDIELYDWVSNEVQNYITTYTDVTSPYNITDLPAGSYMVKVVDSNENSSDCIADITGPEELVCEITGSEDVSCYEGSDGSATVEASGGTAPYSYLWSDGQTTATASGLSAGDYTVTITDANGCETECEVTISEPEELVCEITGSEDVSCYEGSDGSATVEASGGTAPYSYLWSDGQTTATATGLSAGDYTVTITDANGCETECEVTISEPTELTCYATADSEASCDGTEGGSATVYPSGGTPEYTYLWSDGQTTATATNLAAGVHTVIVTDANGCETECEVEITREPEFFVCETAFALLGEDPEIGCFLNDGFDRWGWTNLISESDEAYVMPLWSGAGQCDTDKGVHSGNAVVTYLNGTVSVEYHMFEGFVLKEAHVYVGYDPYPSQKRGKTTVYTVAPGQYNYNSGSLDDVDELTDIIFEGLEGDVYVIIHGVACEVVCMWDEPEALAVGFYQNLAAPTKGKKSAEILPSGIESGDFKIYPNPFSDKVTFEFVSPKDARARLEINNVLGQRITVLMDENVAKGVMNRIEYKPVDVVSGILIYRLILDDDVNTGRLIYRK